MSPSYVPIRLVLLGSWGGFLLCIGLKSGARTGQERSRRGFVGNNKKWGKKRTSVAHGAIRGHHIPSFQERRRQESCGPMFISNVRRAAITTEHVPGHRRCPICAWSPSADGEALTPWVRIQSELTPTPKSRFSGRLPSQLTLDVSHIRNVGKQTPLMSKHSTGRGRTSS